MRSRGLAAEEQAVHFLVAQGYQVLVRNYQCRYGEIDVIARQGDTLCFVEVKSRSKPDFGSPAEAVNRIKQRRIARTAAHYLMKKYPAGEPACRFDVVTILPQGEPEIMMNAFFAE
ncbi:YraN family protein [candidate division FCPU426 bacterium]|nr:YraN family protein [candidate division FCPU426 bacterium]